MKERERILELVKQGIISTEEALTLLENSAKKEGKEAVRKDESTVQETTTENPADHSEFPQAFPEEQEKPDIEEAYLYGEESLKEEQKKDREQLEAILEQLANEASGYSAKLDEVNEKIGQVKDARTEAQMKLTILNAQENLGEESAEQENSAEELETQIEEKSAQLENLEKEKAELEEKLQSTKKRQWGTQKKQFSEKFEIPEDWKETATETFSQVSGKVTEAGSQFSRLMKETFSTVADSMEWKDVNVRVPGLSTTKLTHTFHYPDSTASILDVKLANGDVVFKNGDSEDIRVEANIKIYGKLDTEDPFEAFQKRSTIEVNDENITFHVPNKRVRCDLIFYMPERTYDHTSVKLLNGNVKFENFDGKDFYVKSTNGNIDFEDLTATMLEAEGVNGNVKVTGSQIRDLIVNSINGNIVIRGEVKSGNVSTVNGTVKTSLRGKELKRLDATSVNGTVKVALPRGISLEGDVKSNFGSIQNRMGNVEIIKEKKDRTNQFSSFRRVTENEPFILKVNTTTGGIMLKDSE